MRINSDLAKEISQISKELLVINKNLYERLADYNEKGDIKEIEIKVFKESKVKEIDTKLYSTILEEDEKVVILSEDDIKYFNKELTLNGLVRDKNLLLSAINSPFMTFGGCYLYRTTIDKASQLFYSLVSNHPFVDGNKRTSVHSMLIFLRLNEVVVDFIEDELFSLTMKASRHELDRKDISNYLKSKLVKEKI